MHTHANYLANYAFSEVLYIKRELVCLSLCLNMIINAQQRPKNAFFITSKGGIISLSHDACDLITAIATLSVSIHAISQPARQHLLNKRKS